MNCAHNGELTARVVILYYGYDLSGARLWLVLDTLVPAEASDFRNLTMFRANGNGFQGAGDYSLTPWGSLDFKSTSGGASRFTLTPSGRDSSEPGDGFNIWTANAGPVLFFYGYDRDGGSLRLVSSPYYGPIIPGHEIELDLVTGSEQEGQGL